MDERPAKAARTGGEGASASTPAGTAAPANQEHDREEEDEEEAADAEAEARLMREEGNESDERMAALLASFTPEQLDRYEQFVRSHFSRLAMKRVLSSVMGVQPSVQIQIIVCGVAKLFVGELVETARAVMEERSEEGPIRPCHIREAHRRMSATGRTSVDKGKRGTALFRR
mmetsp:Transcript_20599/g.66793  ORF Transcript_20599/g.66793 Transcript_20599/m.66793 type:complete len:172 (+) Transcript_20599:64-579(+)